MLWSKHVLNSPTQRSSPQLHSHGRTTGPLSANKAQTGWDINTGGGSVTSFSAPRLFVSSVWETESPHTGVDHWECIQVKHYLIPQMKVLLKITQYWVVYHPRSFFFHRASYWPHYFVCLNPSVQQVRNVQASSPETKWGKVGVSYIRRFVTSCVKLELCHAVY